MRAFLTSFLGLLGLAVAVSAQTSHRETVVNGLGGLASNGTTSQVTSIAQPISVGTSTFGLTRNQAGFLSTFADIALSQLAAYKGVELVIDADGDGKPSPGDTLRYTVSVTNTGNVDATGVQLVDMVDTNTMMVVTNSVAIKPVAGDDGYATTAGVSLVVSAPGVLANDSDPDSSPSPISVGAADTTSANGGTVSVAADGGFTYGAAVGFSGTDTFSYEVTDGLATDSATVSIDVAEVADLSVTKSDDVDPVGEGEPLVYTVIVSNAGPTVASEVTVTDTLPGSVTLSMVSGGIFACSNPAPGVVMCTGGPIAAGTAATITIPVTPNAVGTITNTVTVSTTANDGNGGNDSAMEETVVEISNSAPVATNDSYTTFGNVRLTVDMTSGVLSNDTDPDMDVLFVSDFDTNSTLGGVVAVATNGSFTYDPPVGMLGTDTWTYVVSDGVATDTGMVEVVIGGATVWFVDNRVIGPGTGTQADPFNDLSSLNGPLGSGDSDQPGDVIFIFEGTGAAYVGGLDAEANQRLFGEPNGLTLSGRVIVAAGGNRPLITHTAEGSKLGTNVELDSVAFHSMGNFGISGQNFGTLTMDNISASSDGRAAMFLNNGTANLTGISCTSTNSSTDGLVLNSVEGTVQIIGGSISAANGRGVRISGGSAQVTVACSIENSLNRSVEIENRTGGLVILSGPINDTGSGILVRNNSGGTVVTFSGAGKVFNTGSSTAVDLSNNTGATINFTNGGLDIDTTSSTGFSVTGGGTINVTGPNNTINTGTGTGINIQNTALGPNGVAFQSVAVNGAAVGIDIDGGGSAGFFAITGVGAADGSGGTIQNTTQNGILIENTDNIMLANLNLNNATDEAGGCLAGVDQSSSILAPCTAALEFNTVSGIQIDNMTIDGDGDASDELGIFAQQVTDFDMTGVTVRNVSDAVDEHGIYVVDLLGTAGASTDSHWSDVVVDNTVGDTGILIVQTSGTGELLMDGASEIADAREGGFEARTDSAAADLTVTIGNTSAVGVGDTVVIDNANIGAAFFAEGGALIGTVQNTILRSGSGTASISRAGSGNSGVLFVGIAAQSTSPTADITLNATGNDIDHEDGGAGGSGRSGIALSGSGNLNGVIVSNMVDSNDEFVDGLFMNFTGVGTTSENQVTVADNILNMTGSGGNDTIAGIEINASDSTGGLSISLTGNDVTYAGDNGFSAGIVLVAGDQAGGNNNVLCVDVIDNKVTSTSAGSFGHYGFVQFPTATLNISGVGPGVVTDAQVDAYIIANDDPAATTTGADINAVVGTINGVTSCP